MVSSFGGRLLEPCPFHVHLPAKKRRDGKCGPAQRAMLCWPCLVLTPESLWVAHSPGCLPSPWVWGVPPRGHFHWIRGRVHRAHPAHMTLLTTSRSSCYTNWTLGPAGWVRCPLLETPDKLVLGTGAESTTQNQAAETTCDMCTSHQRKTPAC